MEMSEKKPLLTRRVLYLSTDALRPNPHQPRRDFDEGTLRGFEAILSGEMDDYPEMAFYNVGTLDDALAKAKKMKGGEEG